MKYNIKFGGYASSTKTKTAIEGGVQVKRYLVQVSNAKRYVDYKTYVSMVKSYVQTPRVSKTAGDKLKKQLWWRTRAGQVKDAKILRDNMIDQICNRYDITDKAFIKEARDTLKAMSPEKLKQFADDNEDDLKTFFENSETLTADPWAYDYEMESQARGLIAKMKGYI